MKKMTLLVGVAVIATLGWGAYTFFIAPSAQKAATTSQKVYHVGILDALDYFTPAIAGFKEKMTELGYVEGKNIVYDVKKEPAPVGNQAVLEKFVQDKVDLIVAFPTEATLEAKEATKGTNIPIVSLEAAVEASGLIESIRHPGGNITGVRFPVPEIASRRLEILHQIVTSAKRLWIPYLKDYPTVAVALAAIKPRADALGLTITESPVNTPDELKADIAAFESRKDIGIDAVLMIPEPISIIPPFEDQIYAFADQHHIPVVAADILDTDTGPIFGLIPDSANVGALAAPLADKIFHGTPPGDIPFATPETKFEINYRVIKKLGLSVDQSLLSTADLIVH